jgi:hypothetical protein
MATLIQASSMPYPGRDAILDVERSLSFGEPRPAKAGDDVADVEPGTPPGEARAA